MTTTPQHETANVDVDEIDEVNALDIAATRRALTAALQAAADQLHVAAQASGRLRESHVYDIEYIESPAAGDTDRAIADAARFRPRSRTRHRQPPQLTHWKDHQANEHQHRPDPFNLRRSCRALPRAVR